MKVTFCDVCGDPTPAPSTLRLEKAPTMIEGDYELCVPCSRQSPFPTKMPTRSKIAPGCQVTYIGPHVEGYLPALNIGLVEHVGPTRSRVRYPWGCHSILTNRLRVVDDRSNPIIPDWWKDSPFDPDHPSAGNFGEFPC